MILGHHHRHHFDGSPVIKALTRADIQVVGNGVQLLFGYISIDQCPWAYTGGSAY